MSFSAPRAFEDEPQSVPRYFFLINRDHLLRRHTWQEKWQGQYQDYRWDCSKGDTHDLGHVRSNGHYHYKEAILVLDWMAPASPWQRRQGRWGTCQDCEKRWTLRGRLPRRRGWNLNRTWCHPNIWCIFETIQICVLTCLLWWSVCVFVCLSRKK